MLGAESLMNLSGRQDFTWLVTPVARGIKHVLCDTSRRGILDVLSRLCPVLLSISLFCLYPFTVTNFSQKYDYMSPPNVTEFGDYLKDS